jgi:hypothetical protein
LTNKQHSNANTDNPKTNEKAKQQGTHDKRNGARATPQATDTQTARQRTSDTAEGAPTSDPKSHEKAEQQGTHDKRNGTNTNEKT